MMIEFLTRYLHIIKSFRGLFRGAGTRMLFQTPAAGITMTLYEKVLHFRHFIFAYDLNYPPFYQFRSLWLNLLNKK